MKNTFKSLIFKNNAILGYQTTTSILQPSFSLLLSCSLNSQFHICNEINPSSSTRPQPATSLSHHLHLQMPVSHILFLHGHTRSSIVGHTPHRHIEPLESNSRFSELVRQSPPSLTPDLESCHTRYDFFFLSISLFFFNICSVILFIF